VAAWSSEGKERTVPYCLWGGRKEKKIYADKINERVI
jgi:hypothetical protein